MKLEYGELNQTALISFSGLNLEFCRSILEPYERIFPRKKESVVDNVNSIINNASNNNSNTITEKPATKSSHQKGEQEQQQELPLITSS